MALVTLTDRFNEHFGEDHALVRPEPPAVVRVERSFTVPGGVFLGFTGPSGAGYHHVSYDDGVALRDALNEALAEAEPLRRVRIEVEIPANVAEDFKSDIAVTFDGRVIE